MSPFFSMGSRRMKMKQFGVECGASTITQSGGVKVREMAIVLTSCLLRLHNTRPVAMLNLSANGCAAMRPSIVVAVARALLQQ
jgi:hypothetical protein